MQIDLASEELDEGGHVPSGFRGGDLIIFKRSPLESAKRMSRIHEKNFTCRLMWPSSTRQTRPGWIRKGALQSSKSTPGSTRSMSKTPEEKSTNLKITQISNHDLECSTKANTSRMDPKRRSTIFQEHPQIHQEHTQQI